MLTAMESAPKLHSSRGADIYCGCTAAARSIMNESDDIRWRGVEMSQCNAMECILIQTGYRSSQHHVYEAL